MADRIQLRRDTAANWVSANPVLAQGEMGVELDSGKAKIGNGATAWNSLAYADCGIDTSSVAAALAALQDYTIPVSGPASLSLPAGESIQFELTAFNSYSTYSVAATSGTVSRVGSVITYTAPQTTGSDTVTIVQDDVITHELTISVFGYRLAASPDPAPAIGAAYAGGFYAGAIWDTVCTGTANLTVATGEKTLVIPGGDLPLYFGQQVRLAPANNASRQYLHGTVATRDGVNLVVAVESVEGSGSYSGSWVVAARWKIVLAPKATGDFGGILWKISNTDGPVETRTLTNGKAATAAMIAAGDASTYPLAWTAKVLNDAALNGYADWYIPALDELELVWRNLKPVTNNNVTTRPSASVAYVRDANYAQSPGFNGSNLHSDPVGAAYTSANPAQTPIAAFASGGAEAMVNDWYWSSSEFSTYYGWGQVFSTAYPGYQDYGNKSNAGRARAVRRSIL